MEEKIWKPIQACNDGIWSIDKKSQLEKTFCCIGATTLDYAKFGRLFLNKGQWNNNQIISENWLNDCIKNNEHGEKSQRFAEFNRTIDELAS